MNQIFNDVLALCQELDSLRPLSADQEQRIWQKFRLDWNYHSNHLEGNSLTYGETKSLLLHNITAQGKPLKDHLEITGHNEAIFAILDTVKNQQPLTESFLRQLHSLILKERYQVNAQTPDGQSTKKWVEVGQYKSSPNHVLTVTGEIFRFAEPFEVPAKMQALIEQASIKQTGVIEALIQAAKLHYEFVLIHPFDDGNGRMARILMNLVLMQNGLPPAIIKTETKEAYFSALQQADGGQFEVFAQYIAERVAESMRIMLAGARGKVIEEPDDLDKEIALLKGTLFEIQEGKELPEKSPQVLAEWYEKLLLPLINEFTNTCKKLSVFYTHLHYGCSLDDFVVHDSIESIHNHIFTRLQSNSLQKIILVANFSEIKLLGAINPNINIAIVMELDSISWKLSISDGLKKYYRYNANFSEINLIEFKKEISQPVLLQVNTQNDLLTKIST